MARVAPLLLAALLAAVLTALGSGVARAGIEIQVIRCDGEQAEKDREACERRQVQTQEKRRQQSSSGSRQQQSSPSGSTTTQRQRRTEREIHTYSLRSGRGRVERADGTEEEVEAELEVHPEAEREERARHRRRQAARPTRGSGPARARLPVQTTGGSTMSELSLGALPADQAVAQFAIPPFLLPIYVAAGRAYGIPWNLLAAINQVETDFGRNLAVSSAGALGWMQFMPGTWQAYGVDASGNGVADPWNPVDAIYAAARYLKASGAPEDLRGAIFAYNRANWYVDMILERARVYGSLPGGLVAQTGSLAFGRFPVVGPVRYGDDFRAAELAGETPRGLRIEARPGARAVATQPVQVERVLVDRRLARALRHRAERPADRASSRDRREAERVQSVARHGALALAALAVGDSRPLARHLSAAAEASDGLRLERGTVAGRGDALPEGYAISRHPGVGVVVRDGVGNRYAYRGLERLSSTIRPGARLRGGQSVGTLSVEGERAAVRFSVSTPGGEPVDPRPLVDGYRLQEAADFQSTVGDGTVSPFVSTSPQGSDVISGSERALAARVLSDPGIEIYPGGRGDIARGEIDKRVLGAILYLRQNGLTMTITSLKSGRSSLLTASGNMSNHPGGRAVDIAAFNGQSVLGNQGPGSPTEHAVKLLMQLEGEARPSEIISLFDFGRPSFAMADHADHLHIGYPAIGGELDLARSGQALGDVVFGGGQGVQPTKPSREDTRRLSRRFGDMDHPSVPKGHGRGSIPVGGDHDDDHDHGHEHPVGEEAEHKHDDPEHARRIARERWPLVARDAAAGARLDDVSSRPGAGGAEAWAVGLVDGTALPGWAEQQSVVLRHRSGRWRIVGPPRDHRGRVVNPRLRAIDVARSGKGWAVGDRGYAVRIEPGAPPRLARTGTRSDLLAVAVRDAGETLNAVAVGERGTVARLGGGERGVQRAEGAPTFSAVAIGSDGHAIAVGDGAAGPGPVLVRESGSGLSSVGGLEPPADASLNLRAVSVQGTDLWVAGAIGPKDVGDAGAGSVEVPFLARRGSGAWITYCEGTPGLVGVRELGEPTSGCDRDLVAEAGRAGPATAIAETERGVVVATPSGLQLGDERGFRLVPDLAGRRGLGEGGEVRALALGPDGVGFTLTRDRRLSEVVRSSGDLSRDGGSVQRLPVGSGQGLARLAVPAQGGGALATAGGRIASFDGSGWRAGGGPAVDLIDAAAGSPRTGWGVAVTGHLVALGAALAVAPDGEADAARLAEVSRALGSGPLEGERSGAEPVGGFRAVTLRSTRDGWAVGAHGLAARFDGTRWRTERVPGRPGLVDVAAGAGGVFAVGADGALLERGTGGWRRVDEARRLVSGQDFTAAAELADGATLAVAGGTLIARGAAGSEWRSAGIEPLGQRLERLAAYRGRDGRPRAVALVASDSGGAVLIGDRHGWRSVPLGAGVRPTDVAVDESRGDLWVAGRQASRAVALRRSLPEARTVNGGQNGAQGVELGLPLGAGLAP